MEQWIRLMIISYFRDSHLILVCIIHNVLSIITLSLYLFHLYTPHNQPNPDLPPPYPTSPPNPTGLLPPPSGKIAKTLYTLPIPPPPLSTNLSTALRTLSLPPSSNPLQIISPRSLTPIASNQLPCSTGPCASTFGLAFRAASARAVKSTSAEMSTRPGEEKGETRWCERMPRRVDVGMVEEGP